MISKAAKKTFFDAQKIAYTKAREIDQDLGHSVAISWSLGITASPTDTEIELAKLSRFYHEKASRHFDSWYRKDVL